MKLAKGTISSPYLGITNLPEEILLQIITLLQPNLKLKSWKPCGSSVDQLYRSIAKLSHVSRTCRRVATSLLYNNVELPNPASLFGRRSLPLGQKHISGDCNSSATLSERPHR